MNDRWQIILDIVTVCKRMWQKGWVANHDGNVTARLGPELLATPTAVSKADIIPEIILTLDMEGKKIAGPGKSFSEINLHLAAYKARPDIQAVVHAHPPYATALGACGRAIENIFIPEAIVSIGNNVPVVPYSMPGSAEGAESVANALYESNVVILQGNGVLAVGADIMQAYLRIELVEHLAKMATIASQIGTPFEIPAEDVSKLLEKRTAAGMDPKKMKDERRGTRDEKPVDHDQLRKIIAEELNKLL